MKDEFFNLIILAGVSKSLNFFVGTTQVTSDYVYASPAVLSRALVGASDFLTVVTACTVVVLIHRGLA